MKLNFSIFSFLVCLCLHANSQSAPTYRRVMLPNPKLIGCTSPDCYQLLDAALPEQRDIRPTYVNVAFLGGTCPFGVDATYDKQVPLDELRHALTEQYGEGTAENWTHAPVYIWQVKKSHLYIQLDVADKTMAANRKVEEGTRTIHFTDTDTKGCHAH